MSKIYQKMYLQNKNRSKGVLGGFMNNAILRGFYSESQLCFDNSIDKKARRKRAPIKAFGVRSFWGCAGNVWNALINKVILKCCYSESHPFSSKRTGFTLIELLVVVLIIGILAAIALPQYETAVKKSRLARYFPVVASLAQAEEVYFLNNGMYSASADKLDIALPSGTPANGNSDYGYIKLEDGTKLDLLGGTADLPAGAADAYVAVISSDGIEYILYLQQSAYPGRRKCNGDEQVCKSLGCTDYNASDGCILP